MSGAQFGTKNPSSSYYILHNVDLLNLVGKYFMAWYILEENKEQSVTEYRMNAKWICSLLSRPQIILW